MLHKIADRFEVLKPRPGFAWERLVKQPRALGTLLLRVYPLVVGRFTSRWGHAIFVFSCTVRRLWLKQGSKGLVLFLKSCYVATQQAAGGYRIPNVQLVGARIARTSGGLPRIIMKDHRSLIRSGAPWVVAMYLTLFGLYRVIEYPGKVKIRTITDLCLLRQTDLSLFEGFIPLFYLKLVYCVSSKARSLGIGNKTAVSPKFVAQELDYLPLDSPHPTLRPTKFTLILKASPTSAPLAGAEVDPLWVHRDADSLKSPFYQLKERCGLISRLFRPLTEDERGILQAMWKRWKESKKRTSSAGSLFWTTSIWMGSALLPFLIEWVKLTDAKVIKQLFKAAYTKRFNKLDPWGTSAKLGEPFKATSYNGLGKLGFKDEPAGKVRVFAMVDVITQTLMSPLHEWLFRVLKRIPQDGTHDQTAPLDRLMAKGHQTYHSYDLSAATDRLPIMLQQKLLAYVIGQRMAELWYMLLVGRNYEISTYARKRYPEIADYNCVQYGAGQPMGALSSWAMLALTHHAIVQWAAVPSQGRNARWFEDYALLGDDIVIANDTVAKEYLRIMRELLHVEIGLHKSLISSNGTLEFAKRTIVRNQDATPISLKGFLGGQQNLGVLEAVISKLGNRWHGKMSSVARSLGYGFRSLARLNTVFRTRSRLQGTMIFFTRPQGLCAKPFFEWIAQDQVDAAPAIASASQVDALRHSLLDRIISGVESSLLRRQRLLSREHRGPWMPTPVAPTRTMYDTWKQIFIDPLLVVVKQGIEEVSDLKVKVETSTIENQDQLNQLYAELAHLENEVALLPKDARLGTCQVGDPIEPRNGIIERWRKLRRVSRDNEKGATPGDTQEGRGK